MYIETELMGALREKAELDAINVFARNLKACCWRRRPASAPPWAWTRACAPA
jgi:transcriptional accessory protein Tex/SPT6